MLLPTDEVKDVKYYKSLNYGELATINSVYASEMSAHQSIHLGNF